MATPSPEVERGAENNACYGKRDRTDALGDASAGNPRLPYPRCGAGVGEAEGASARPIELALPLPPEPRTPRLARCRALAPPRYATRPHIPLGRADIVVADRLGSHKGVAARQAIEARGAELMLLPSYSHDLNPIETVWTRHRWM